MTTSHDFFLQAQSREYQVYTSRLGELNTALEHQRLIQNNKIIPKQYLPKQLKTFTSTLTEFEQKYQTLFFQHLEKVIVSNNIKIVLIEGTLTNIITQTERYLNTLTIPPQEITKLYNKFVSENEIKHHIPIPELQAKLQQSKHPDADPSITKTKRRRPKRKNTAPTPSPRKVILFYPQAHRNLKLSLDSSQPEQFYLQPRRTNTAQ